MKKLLFLCFVLLLALSSAGGAYALWSEMLYIDGTVETGTVSAEWTFVGCFDIEGKDVGHTSAQIDPLDPRILHFTIDNGYPCYTGDCQVEFEYTGSVPGIVEAIEFVAGPGLTNCTVVQDGFGTTTATCDQLEAKWVDNLGVQLHQGDQGASSVRVHVEQDADQNAEYTFEFRVQLVQYNESVFYP